jgi:integrase
MTEHTENRLTARQVETAGDGWWADGGCLYLRIDGSRRRWIVRVTRDGRKRDFGVGSADRVSLRLARQKRDEILAQLKDGLDPVAAKRERLAKAKTEALRGHSFREAAEAVMRNREAAWKKGSSSFASWMKYLFRDAKPLHRLPVGEIGVNEVKAVVAPFWARGHHVAARALLSRIELVLAFAIAHEWRTSANVAAWSIFEHIAPARPNGGKKHHQMVPWRDMPAFVAKLRQSKDSMSAVALELITLTACRSNEVRALKWSEVDSDAKLLTVPPERMKRSVEFKVPLSKQALALLKPLYEARHAAPLIFPGPRPNKPIANQALWTQMGRATGKTATTHGLRASFRSWCSDVGVDDQLAEFCLAHGPKNAVQAAYNRAETVERRREVMQRWADFLDGKESAKVVAIGSGRKRR